MDTHTRVQLSVSYYTSNNLVIMCTTDEYDEAVMK